VHVPIGLLAAVPVLDAACWWDRAPPDAARWALGIGLLFGSVAAILGFLDFTALPPRHPAGRLATAHLALMTSALSAFGVSFVLRAPAVAPSAAAVGWGIAGLALLLVGGYTGGELVYGHGVATPGEREVH
jgi:uncharacterized membrane protein